MGSSSRANLQRKDLTIDQLDDELCSASRWGQHFLTDQVGTFLQGSVCLPLSAVVSSCGYAGTQGVGTLMNEVSASQ